tara:strand:+ start:112 stop:504 length:393 start_codon:yes stop_codon:yes gene_type:complete
MVKILILCTDEIDFDVLKSFKYDKFTNTAYGKIYNKWWFVYGDFDIELYYPKKKKYENAEAFLHITKKANVSFKLINICNSFDKHINNENTDIYVEGMSKGNLIEFIFNTIQKMSKGDHLINNNFVIYYQ